MIRLLRCALSLRNLPFPSMGKARIGVLNDVQCTPSLILPRQGEGNEYGRLILPAN